MEGSASVELLGSHEGRRRFSESREALTGDTETILPA